MQPKVDVSVDLFDMLRMDDPIENASDTAPSEDWAVFQGKFYDLIFANTKVVSK